MPNTVVHFDCFSGLSGDMVLGALLDVGIEASAIQTVFDSLGLGIRLEVETVKRCGFRATKANVICKDEDDYRFLPDIEAIIATPEGQDTSRSTSLPVAFGHLADGRFVIVVYRWIDQATVQPLTAYEVPE